MSPRKAVIDSLQAQSFGDLSRAATADMET